MMYWLNMIVVIYFPLYALFFPSTVSCLKVDWQEAAGSHDVFDEN